MRILIATETYRPTVSGVVIFVDDHIEYLRKAGHEVALFRLGTSKSLRKFQDERGVWHYVFPSMVIPFRRATRVAFRQHPLVKRAFRDFQPDLIHIHTPIGMPTALLRIAQKEHVPVVATNHFSFEFLFSFISTLSFMQPVSEFALATYFNGVYGRCDYVTCPTDTIRRDLWERGLSTNFRVVSNGVDSNLFTPAKTLPDKRTNLVYSGRLDADKSVNVVIEAFARAKLPKEVELVLMGTGREEEGLQMLAEELGCADRVRFMGVVDRRSKKYSAIFAQARAFVTASEIETQCIAGLESFAFGVPMVAANKNALPELVEDGVTGYLFEPGSAKACAACMEKIFTSDRDWKKMSAAARARAEDHDISETFKTFDQLYHLLSK